MEEYKNYNIESSEEEEIDEYEETLDKQDNKNKKNKDTSYNNIKIKYLEDSQKELNTNEANEYSLNKITDIEIYKDKNNIIEVKNKRFVINNEIYENILYDNRIFKLSNIKHKDNETLTYFCGNRRKYEYKKEGLFCKAIINKKRYVNTIAYELKKTHSNECNKLYNSNINIKNNKEIINNYNDYNIIIKFYI